MLCGSSTQRFNFYPNRSSIAEVTVWQKNSVFLCPIVYAAFYTKFTKVYSEEKCSLHPQCKSRGRPRVSAPTTRLVLGSGIDVRRCTNEACEYGATTWLDLCCSTPHVVVVRSGQSGNSSHRAVKMSAPGARYHGNETTRAVPGGGIFVAARRGEIENCR